MAPSSGRLWPLTASTTTESEVDAGRQRPAHRVGHDHRPGYTRPGTRRAESASPRDGVVYLRLALEPDELPAAGGSTEVRLHRLPPRRVLRTLGRHVHGDEAVRTARKSSRRRDRRRRTGRLADRPGLAGRVVELRPRRTIARW